MTKTQMQHLKPGDLVRHKSSEFVMIVTANYGDRVTLVRTSDLTNPIEWEVIDQDTGKPKPE